MTLKEKMKLIATTKCEKEGCSFLNQKLSDIEIDLLQKATYEFAIEFAEWCDDNYFRMGNTSIWSDSTDWENNIKITTKELLEIYKNQKGL
jgi:hypothetical protein